MSKSVKYQIYFPFSNFTQYINERVFFDLTFYSLINRKLHIIKHFWLAMCGNKQQVLDFW